MQVSQTHQPSIIEKVIFKHRFIILMASLLLTVFMAWRASFVAPDTRMDRLVPGNHPFVLQGKEFLDGEVASGGGFIRIAVVSKSTDVFDYEYLTKLQSISDEISLLAGVNTGSLKSLWSPAMRWYAITPAGYASGPIIDTMNFSDSVESMQSIRTNVLRAGIVGNYISNDFSATMIDFQILSINPDTRAPINLQDLSQRLESVREKYQGDDLSIHIIGDEKKLADLVDGFSKVLIFFAVALVITTILLYHYSRCFKSTIIPLLCSLIAVIWQLGTLNLIGMGVGVFSVLVPFLVFAIAVSHGVQMINGIAHESAKGENKLNAARITFHHLHRPGMVALLSDGMGFAMLFMIDIGAIQDLALVASIGVALVIFTNLVLLPILMSYFGVSQRCIEHAQYKQNQKSRLWEFTARFTEKPYARFAMVVAVVLAIWGGYKGLDLKVGDLDKGAPELRADSRYNLDNVYIIDNFTTSTDLMTIFVGTKAGSCESFKTIELIERLGWQLTNTPGVQSVSSPATRARMNRYLSNEGNLRFMSLTRDERVLSRAMASDGYGISGGVDENCNQQRLSLGLTDHKAQTLQSVVNVVREFARNNDDQDVWFKLGDGNAVHEAATNEVIETSQYTILSYVYAVVAFMVLLTFRSWRAVACILIPLILTSVMSQGLMAILGIGVKVATLPVIALGVGIGVDYGIYIYSRLVSVLESNHNLKYAYLETLKTTGKAVFFTGITLSVGVATWIYSPIKFQADMGVLLTFMFLWNMIGALVLLPALVFYIKPAVSQDPELSREGIA